MRPAIKPLHPLFAAEFEGIACAGLDDAAFAGIRDAFETYSVLVFRGQEAMTDDEQIAFSRRFGELEVTLKANPGAGTYFARQSNLDATTDEVIPAEDRRMLHAKANLLWHTDSSYKPVPSLCSLLLARIVPPVGANTEFCTLRSAYDELPQERKDELLGLEAHHSLQHSRNRVDPRALTEEMRNELPGAVHPLVRTNLRNGRKALFCGSHASHVIGWPLDEGRRFIDELNDHAGQQRFVYSHVWRPGDLVLWDNRAVLHRATPFDAQKYKRLLQRTTVAGNDAEYREERRLARLDAMPATA
jgi:alpha-ketoglutarate-dependent 2,4-dichlorophenoxyacetate dioxygenase